MIAARQGEIVDHWKLLRAGWADHRDVDPETLRTHLNHLNQKLVAEGHPGPAQRPRPGLRPADRRPGTIG